MKEASFYENLKGKKVRCTLCPNYCEIYDGKVGVCKVRENINGILFTKNYNHVAAIAIDPIEKKPLNKFMPNTKIFSIGTFGCNFKCDFCQNYHISQREADSEYIDSDSLLNLSYRANDSIGIAFTYNEPTIWYEYVYEVAKKNKRKNVLVTNGYINKEPLEQLLPFINAMNIDIKSINPHFYEKFCKGKLESVKNSIKIANEKTHVELTFMAIPDINDSKEEMNELSQFIANINKKIPLHIIPFRPMYKMSDYPYQSYEKIHELKSIASNYLLNIY